MPVKTTMTVDAFFVILAVWTVVVYLAIDTAIFNTMSFILSAIPAIVVAGAFHATPVDAAMRAFVVCAALLAKPVGVGRRMETLRALIVAVAALSGLIFAVGIEAAAAAIAVAVASVVEPKPAFPFFDAMVS